MNKLLEIRDLEIQIKGDKDTFNVLNNISLKINKNEIVAVVGESGSGKSMTANSIMRLLPDNSIISNGEITFKGRNLLELSKKEMRKVRGNQISMIFQEPMTSLNPLYTVGNQLREITVLHQKISKSKAKEIGINMLKKVGIADAEKVYKSYPHSLSGGMRQRVMIAMALSCNPELLIADEPTTALDVTIQAQILNIMREIKETHKTSILLITHDLGVVAEIADRVVVVYGGEVVEESDVYQLFKNPKHPYTKKLLNSTPKIDETRKKLDSIKGNVPYPTDMPSGCFFHPRCPVVMETCKARKPVITDLSDGSSVRCLHFEDIQVGDAHE